jgi:hypothetical protein
LKAIISVLARYLIEIREVFSFSIIGIRIKAVIKMTEVICVTGMHRSGTSLTTSWLECCGLQVSDGNLMKPGMGNEKGHFEDLDFVQLHAQSIQARLPSSKGWIVTDAQAASDLNLNQERAQQLVDIRNQKYPIWGWKDPRTVFFLEQWSSLIPHLKVLLLWRPCWQVMDSLQRRKNERQGKSRSAVNISALNAIRLWLLSNASMLAYYRNHPESTLIFPLSTIIDEDAQVLSIINQKFGLQFQYRPISEVLDSDLLNNRSFSPKILLNLVPPVRILTSSLKAHALKDINLEPIDKPQ